MNRYNFRKTPVSSAAEKSKFNTNRTPNYSCFFTYPRNRFNLELESYFQNIKRLHYQPGDHSRERSAEATLQRGQTLFSSFWVKTNHFHYDCFPTNVKLNVNNVSLLDLFELIKKYVNIIEIIKASCASESRGKPQTVFNEPACMHCVYRKFGRELGTS